LVERVVGLGRFIEDDPSRKAGDVRLVLEEFEEREQ